jgi:hypothetical protein
MTTRRTQSARPQEQQAGNENATRPAAVVREPAARGGRAVQAAWDRLAGAVAEALAVLSADQVLVLSSKRRGYFVELAALGPDGVHAEAVSNVWLRPKHALDAQQMTRLAALGWSAPTVSRAAIDAFEEADEDAERPVGTSNHFRDWAAPAPFAAIATLAVTTLREVYGIRRPEQLEYVAFAPGPREILLPSLGIPNLPMEEDDEDESDHVHANELLRPENPAQLQEAVIEALKSCTDLEDPAVDEDGDIPLRYGSSLIILRVADDAPFVMLASPLLTGVAASPEVNDAVNELARSHRQVRFYHANGTVHAALDLIGDPFVPDHLEAALAVMGRLCDELGPDLQHRLGGSTAFEAETHSRPRRRKHRYN